MSGQASILRLWVFNDFIIKMRKKETDYSDSAFGMFRNNPASKAPKKSFDHTESKFMFLKEEKEAII